MLCMLDHAVIPHSHTPPTPFERTIVDIDEYTSELHGDYHYFQVTKNDWHPLTNRLWNV